MHLLFEHFQLFTHPFSGLTNQLFLSLFFNLGIHLLHLWVILILISILIQILCLLVEKVLMVGYHVGIMEVSVCEVHSGFILHAINFILGKLLLVSSIFLIRIRVITNSEYAYIMEGLRWSRGHHIVILLIKESGYWLILQVEAVVIGGVNAQSLEFEVLRWVVLQVVN
jgi:hypothetical protein